MRARTSIGPTASPLWALLAARNVLAVGRPQSGTTRCGLQFPNSLSLDHLDEALGTEPSGYRLQLGSLASAPRALSTP